MIHINEPVVVEGKYDKIKLSGLLDTLIIETDGFSIFKDKEKLDMIRTLADLTGIIVLTDSDAAGFRIRNYLNSAVGKPKVTNVYIPDILGRERRKAVPSKEGKIGVEGMDDQVLLEAFKRAGVIAAPASHKEKITKYHLYVDGLSGTDQSAGNRRLFLKSLNLPQRLSANSLVEVLNRIMSVEEYQRKIEEIFK